MKTAVALSLGLTLACGIQMAAIAALEGDTHPASTAPKKGSPRSSAALETRQGAITALADGKVQLGGQWFHVDEEAKVFRQGKAVGLGSLQVGEAITVGFVPGGSTRKTIAAIHAR